MREEQSRDADHGLDDSNRAAEQLPQVHLNTVRKSSHPWIFQRMAEKPRIRVPPGSVVDILDRKGAWVGRGFYNGHSRIRLRVLTSDPEENIDEAFFAERVARAVRFRRDWLGLDDSTDAYRVVHSEADELSGLVVDRFGPLLVIEFFAAGMWRFSSIIQQILASHFPDSRFYAFAESHVQKQESFDFKAEPPPAGVVIRENSVRFQVTPGSKHKTGFFVDQRENRMLLAQLCRSISETRGSGASVLDICCNTGGFAVYAAALGRAGETIGLDLDEHALELAKRNANLNQARVKFVQTDLFPWIRDAIQNGRQFDIVVLDPSKQTRSREDVPFALKKYLDMNRLALRAVAPGGAFLTCSCTGLVSEEQFLDAVRRAAYQAERTVQIFRISGAGPDHPYLAHVQEGRYLKAVWCRVY